MTTSELTRREALHIGVFAGASGLLPFAARAPAAWPNKAIRFVVPFAPDARLHAKR